MRLAAEGCKLLQAHLADAIPLELLTEEQERITRELANAADALAHTEIHWEVVERNIDLALQVVTDPETACRRSSRAGKRLYNQAFFEAIFIDGEGVTYSRLTEPFSNLLAKGLVAELEEALQAARGRTSKNSHLSHRHGVRKRAIWWR